MDWEGSLEHDLKIKTTDFQQSIPTKTKKFKNLQLFLSYD